MIESRLLRQRSQIAKPLRLPKKTEYFSAFPQRPYTPYGMSSYMQSTPNSIPRKPSVQLSAEFGLSRVQSRVMSLSSESGPLHSKGLSLHGVGLSPKKKRRITFQSRRSQRPRTFSRLYPAPVVQPVGLEVGSTPMIRTQGSLKFFPKHISHRDWATLNNEIWISEELEQRSMKLYSLSIWKHMAETIILLFKVRQTHQLLL